MIKTLVFLPQRKINSGLGVPTPQQFEVLDWIIVTAVDVDIEVFLG